MIGSDQVGQFIGNNGENWLKPEIVKYWKLFDKLTSEAAENIARRAGFGVGLSLSVCLSLFPR